MTANTDAGRLNIDKMRADMRWESRRFAVQLVIGLAAAVGAGAALGNYFTKNAPSALVPVQVQAPPPIIYVIPGQAPPAAASPHAP